MIFGIPFLILAILAIAGISLLFSVGNGRSLYSLGILIIAGVCLWTFGGMPNVIDWIALNYQFLITATLTYFAIGFAWGLGYWIYYTQFSSEMKSTIKLAYERFLQHNPDNFEAFVQSSYYPYGFAQDFPKILAWSVWWPFSLVWTFTNDFLYGVARVIGQITSGLFAAIAKNGARRALNK